MKQKIFYPYYPCLAVRDIVYMNNLSNNKKKNNNITAITSVAVLVIGIFSVVTINQSADAQKEIVIWRSQAPSIVSGDNIYIAWWTNNTENGNEEVMFRASTDAGATFSNSTNLSNTTDADSWRVEIAGEGDTVVVSWWETNQTSDIPVARISTDAGETFGPMIMLGMNGTIDSTAEEVIATEAGEEEGEEGATPEGVIEEAVGGPEVAE